MFLDCTPGFNWPRSRKLTKNLLPWLSLYTQKKLPITAPFKNAFENYTVQTEKATLYKSSVLRIMGMDSKITIIIMLFYCPWYRQCTNKYSVNAPAMVLWIWKVMSNVSRFGPWFRVSLSQRVYARNVRLYYPYRQYTNPFYISIGIKTHYLYNIHFSKQVTL